MKRQSVEPADSGAVPELIAAAEQALPHQAHALARARAFAEPLIAGETLDTGENTLGHADGVAAILKTMGGSEAMQAASYLVYACQHLNKPREVIAKAFGDSYAALALETTALVRVQRQARSSGEETDKPGEVPQDQTENVRKMLLAFSRDLRVVMLRLASRLQTLRWNAARKTVPPAGVAREALTVFAPLANRLGVWQIKWEIEDLAFRFLEPETYHQVARPAGREARRAGGLRRAAAAAAGARAQGAGHRRPGAGSPQAHLQHRQEDARQVAGLRRGVRHPGPARDRAGGARLLRHAVLGARAVRVHPVRIRRLHRQAQAERLPVAAHRGARRGRAGDRNPDPHPVHARARGAWRGRALGLQGSGRQGLWRRRPPPASTTPSWPCCGNCWPGSATSRAPDGAVRGPDLRADAATRRSWNCRRARRRWTSPTPCTPAWAIAAAAPGSTARW